MGCRATIKPDDGIKKVSGDLQKIGKSVLSVEDAKNRKFADLTASFSLIKLHLMVRILFCMRNAKTKVNCFVFGTSRMDFLL